MLGVIKYLIRLKEEAGIAYPKAQEIGLATQKGTYRITLLG